MLNAVLFDLDNTLVDRDEAFRECVSTQFNDPSVRAELLDLDDRGYGDRDKLFATWRRHSGEHIDQPRLGRLIASRIERDELLLQLLGELSRQLKLGIITNGASESQRTKLQAAGLVEVISPDHVWVSAEVGRAKPDPAIFHLASEGLGEVPENCLYVGDHAPTDRTGANAAGMRVRLVERVLTAERLSRLLSELLSEEGVR